MYYGTKNQQIKRLNLESMENLANFEPPHTDTVTSFAFVKDCIISGSRDKALKVWGLDRSVLNLRNSIISHNDWVNTLEC